MIKILIKKTLGLLSPKTLEVLRAIKSRRNVTLLGRQNGATATSRKIALALGLKVHAGPFEGMRFPDALRDRPIAPKLLGTYEQELHKFLADAIAALPDKVVIVGSAEGYYAVGLGRAIPSGEVMAFDIDPWARARCREMADLNGVAARFQMRSFCKPSDLLALRGQKALVVSDCEGFEYRLFTPEVVAALLKSSVIIETHPDVSEGDNAALSGMFGRTHSVQTITFQANARACSEKFAAILSDSEFARAVDEGRFPGQQWLCAKPQTQVV
jgi:hypothetical protein